MKTTIDIPEDMLKEAMENSKATTKRDAVLAALLDYNQRCRQRELIKYLGTFKDFMTQEDLQQSREEREKRHDDRRHQLVDRGASRKRETGSSGPSQKSA
jgi:hypothetical protein